MADISDVEQALVVALSQAIYPNGTQAPSVAGAPVRVYRGWPDPDTLTKDLARGICHVSIYSRPGAGTVEPRAFSRWEEDTRPDATLTVVVDEAAATVTFGGDATGRLMIAVVATGPDQVFTKAIGPGDTPESIAQAFAADIGAVRTASATGRVLTVPGAALQAGAVAGGTARRAVRDQRQAISAIAWCPDPATRDRLAPLMDLAIVDRPRIALPDGTTARIAYQGTSSDDGARAAPIYRRDLLLMASFVTVVAREALPIVAFQARPAPPAPVVPDLPGPAAPAEPVGLVPIRAVTVTINP